MKVVHMWWKYFDKNKHRSRPSSYIIITPSTPQDLLGEYDSDLNPLAWDLATGNMLMLS